MVLEGQVEFVGRIKGARGVHGGLWGDQEVSGVHGRGWWGPGGFKEIRRASSVSGGGLGDNGGCSLSQPLGPGIIFISLAPPLSPR